jgi:hypothetical protein
VDDEDDAEDIVMNPNPKMSSPIDGARYRDDLVSRLTEMGWSVSAAADTGLSTTVLLNDLMIGASVDMNSLFEATDFDLHNSGNNPQLTVFAFSVTSEAQISQPLNTVVRQGHPEVTVGRHQVLDLTGCQVQVSASSEISDTTSRTVAALAASVEQFRLLTT